MIVNLNRQTSDESSGLLQAEHVIRVMQCVFKVHEGTKSKVFQFFKEFSSVKVKGTYLYLSLV